MVWSTVWNVVHFVAAGVVPPGPADCDGEGVPDGVGAADGLFAGAEALVDEDCAGCGLPGCGEHAERARAVSEAAKSALRNLRTLPVWGRLARAEEGRRT